MKIEVRHTVKESIERRFCPKKCMYLSRYFHSSKLTKTRNTFWVVPKKEITFEYYTSDKKDFMWQDRLEYPAFEKIERLTIYNTDLTDDEVFSLETKEEYKWNSENRKWDGIN